MYVDTAFLHLRKALEHLRMAYNDLDEHHTGRLAVLEASCESVCELTKELIRDLKNEQEKTAA